MINIIATVFITIFPVGAMIYAVSTGNTAMLVAMFLVWVIDVWLSWSQIES